MFVYRLYVGNQRDPVTRKSSGTLRDEGTVTDSGHAVFLIYASEDATAAAPLAIYIGLRDVPGVRGALSMALAQRAPRISLQGFGGLILQSLRTDPEIDRLHRELLGW
jgi:hypothetical protein